MVCHDSTPPSHYLSLLKCTVSIPINFYPTLPLTSQTFSLPVQSLTSILSASKLSDPSRQGQCGYSFPKNSLSPSSSWFYELSFLRAAPPCILPKPIWFLNTIFSCNVGHHPQSFLPFPMMLTLRITDVRILNL